MRFFAFASRGPKHSRRRGGYRCRTVLNIVDNAIEDGADRGDGLGFPAGVLGLPLPPDDLDRILPRVNTGVGQGLNGSTSVGEAGPFPSEEKIFCVRKPASKEQIEGLVEPAAGIGPDLPAKRVEVTEHVISLPHAFSFGPFSSPACPPVFGDVIQDAGEVTVAGSGAAPAGPIAQPAFAFLDVFEGVDAVGADEGLSRAGHLVALVDMFEEEAFGSPLGLGALALLFDEIAQLIGIGAGAGMEERVAALVIDLEQGVDEELGEGTGQGGLCQPRDLGGEVVGEIDQGSQGIFHSPEGSFEGGLLGGRPFLLGSVFQLELVVGLGRGFGEIGRALIGDQLEAGRCLFDELCNLDRGLLQLDSSGVEEMTISISGILEGERSWRASIWRRTPKRVSSVVSAIF